MEGDTVMVREREREKRERESLAWFLSWSCTALGSTRPCSAFVISVRFDFAVDLP